MSEVHRPSRKTTDAAIIRANSIGRSLVSIANQYGCHPTSVTLRLKTLGITPTDTRRSFMEDVLTDVPQEVQDWLADLVAEDATIKDVVRDALLFVYNCATEMKETTDGE